MCIIVPEYAITNLTIDYETDSTLLDMLEKVKKIRDEYDVNNITTQIDKLEIKL